MRCRRRVCRPMCPLGCSTLSTRSNSLRLHRVLWQTWAASWTRSELHPAYSALKAAVLQGVPKAISLSATAAADVSQPALRWRTLGTSITWSCSIWPRRSGPATPGWPGGPAAAALTPAGWWQLWPGLCAAPQGGGRQARAHERRRLPAQAAAVPHGRQRRPIPGQLCRARRLGGQHAPAVQGEAGGAGSCGPVPPRRCRGRACAQAELLRVLYPMFIHTYLKLAGSGAASQAGELFAQHQKRFAREGTPAADARAQVPVRRCAAQRSGRASSSGTAWGPSCLRRAEAWHASALQSPAPAVASCAEPPAAAQELRELQAVTAPEHLASNRLAQLALGHRCTPLGCCRRPWQRQRRPGGRLLRLPDAVQHGGPPAGAWPPSSMCLAGTPCRSAWAPGSC